MRYIKNRYIESDKTFDYYVFEFDYQGKVLCVATGIFHGKNPKNYIKKMRQEGRLFINNKKQ